VEKPEKPQPRPCKYGCGRDEYVRWDDTPSHRKRGCAPGWSRHGVCPFGATAYRDHSMRCTEKDLYLSFGCYLRGPMCQGIGAVIDHRHDADCPDSKHSCPACRTGPMCQSCNKFKYREFIEAEIGVEWTNQRLKEFSATTGWTPPASDLIAQGGSLAAVRLLTTMTDLPLAA
jgi:hypothetical protein